MEKSKKIKKTEDWENYKTTEKNAKREIEKAHREYTDKFLNLNASENPQKFSSDIKSKRSNTSRIPRGGFRGGVRISHPPSKIRKAYVIQR